MNTEAAIEQIYATRRAAFARVNAIADAARTEGEKAPAKYRARCIAVAEEAHSDGYALADAQAEIALRALRTTTPTNVDDFLAYEYPHETEAQAEILADSYQLPAPRFNRAERTAAIRAIATLPEADLRDCVANMLQSSTEGFLVPALIGAARGVALRGKIGGGE